MENTTRKAITMTLNIIFSDTGLPRHRPCTADEQDEERLHTAHLGRLAKQQSVVVDDLKCILISCNTFHQTYSTGRTSPIGYLLQKNQLACFSLNLCNIWESTVSQIEKLVRIIAGVIPSFMQRS